MDIAKCGAFITTLRKENNMTQKELASHLDVTDKAVSRWETGKGLPDADSMLGLSALFDVSINELLHGEREVAPLAAEEALADVLHMADKEKKKHHRLRTILAAICGSLIASLLFLFGALVIDDITTGGGTTLSSVSATMRARTIARHIENGRYEAAADDIGFIDRDRRFAEAEWCEAMHAVFDGTVEVTSFTVDPLEEEDQFIGGTAQLRLYDPATEDSFVFEIGVAAQDGIAFSHIACITGDETRGEELAAVIAKALCTYHAG